MTKASLPSGPRRRLRRRRFLMGAAAAAGVLGVAGHHGFKRVARPAPPAGPLSSAALDVLSAAFEGLDAARVLDCHVHVIGLGTGGSGCFVNSRMRSLTHPLAYARFAIYRRAAGIDDLSVADQRYAEHLVALARGYQPHGRLLALAFDYVHREDGSRDLEASEFHVPNDYVLQLVRDHGDVLLPCASIHPYRMDAVAELERVAAAGVRAIKWLPSAMRIDPSSPICDPFYERAAQLGICLVTHGGREAAVDVDDAQKLSNPLHLRRPLDAGVKVVVSHCASSGDGEDLDVSGAAKPRVSNLDLFFRLMDEKRYEGRLFGDVSATTQFNRCDVLGAILARTDLHHRLVNGSDYPLPAINALVRTSTLVSRGLLDEQQRELLNEIDQHNPLAFDFALKRSIRGPRGERFADEVFMPPTDLFGLA